MNKKVVISSCDICPHYDEIDTGACTKTGTEWDFFDYRRGLINPFPTDCPLQDTNEEML